MALMQDTLSFLYSLRTQGSKFGIERMKALVEALGNPQVRFPSIHVAGTNGKGSVCSMLDAVYRAHGYKVGLFTSPHVIELGERIRVNGQNLSIERIEAHLTDLLPICSKMQNEEPGMHPTFFELMTALAFVEFSKQKVDVAVIETGLGGRLDSTNVLLPMVSVITSIGYDHCEILGDRLSEIAREKAGIIKKGKPVVYGWMEREADFEIAKVAKKLKSPVYSLDSISEEDMPMTNLRGAFQRRNAALARKVSEVLMERFPVQPELVRRALNQVKLLGRWQTISSRPHIIVDACHNGHGADASRELWSELPDGSEVWFAACGMVRAKDVLPPLLSRSKRVVLFELDQPKACTHQELKSLTKGFTGDLHLAFQEDIPSLLARITVSETLLITGSIYLVSSVLSRFYEKNDHLDGRNWQDIW